MNLNPFRVFLLFLFSIFLSTSCIDRKIETRLAQHRINQTSDIASLENLSKNSDQTPITWRQAIRKIENSNLRYQTSLKQVRESKKSTRKTWWSLAPDIFTFLNISKNITEITELQSDDLSFSVAANLNIPNPFVFYAQLYGNRLNALRAEWQHELTRRNIHTQLYRAYVELKSIRKSEAILTKGIKLLDSIEGTKFTSELTSIRTRQNSIERRKEHLRLQLNNLLNSPGKNWLLTGTTPNISYSKKLDELTLSNGFGKLGLMLQTIQIEVSLLSLWQVQFNRLPQFSVGVATPPLFSNRSGGSSSFNAEEINLFSGASKSFSIEDPLNLERIRDAQTRTRYTREQLRLTTESELAQLRLLKKQYKYLLQEEANLKSLFLLASKSTSASEPSILLNQLNQLQDLQESLEENQLSQQSIDLQLWIWDENYWNKFN